MIKILMLDIDGVLNSVDYYKRRGGMLPHKSVFEREADELDPIAVDLLKEFVLEYDIDIVISSTWRLLFSIEELKELFALVGWKEIPIIGFTPDLNTIRGEEIEHWLEKCVDPIENYVIIDDDGDMTHNQKLNHFIQTKHATGLLPEHIEQMKKLLQIK